jgi:hypothetical protein
VAIPRKRKALVSARQEETRLIVNMLKPVDSALKNRTKHYEAEDNLVVATAKVDPNNDERISYGRLRYLVLALYQSSVMHTRQRLMKVWSERAAESTIKNENSRMKCDYSKNSHLKAC